MSAILSADDLNDFISPGVACIKPIETLPAAKPTDHSNPYEVTTEDTVAPSDLPPAQISLTDCLACSGCVTSAEAVLVSLQSHAEVLNALDSAPALQLQHNASDVAIDASQSPESRIYVASVSPQVRASLAAAFGVSERVAGNMIQQLLMGPNGVRTGGQYSNGFKWVVDTNAARDACLVLEAEGLKASLEGSQTAPAKPILSSSCPGWICYAEKTHPHVLPHLSTLKSPQALMGTLLKTTLSRKLGVSPDRIWHVAIMPCFDKKLEASREELTDLTWNDAEGRTKGVRDVDCVITSKEVLMLADSRGIEFSALPRVPLPQTSITPFPDAKLGSFLFPPSDRRWANGKPVAGPSGGGLYFTLQYILALNPGSSIQVERGRNADVVEYSVTSASGDTIFKAARYYGFRNIQNLVRKLKPAKVSRMPGSRPLGGARKPGAKSGGPDHAYVEVMACPGGCTNGGGQIKVDDPVVSGRRYSETKASPQDQKEWLALVDEAYFSADESGSEDETMVESSEDGLVVDGISFSHIKDILAYWSDLTGIDLHRLAYTSYRAVVSDVGKDTSHTERVVQLAGKIGGGW